MRGYLVNGYYPDCAHVDTHIAVTTFSSMPMSIQRRSVAVMASHYSNPYIYFSADGQVSRYYSFQPFFFFLCQSPIQLSFHLQNGLHHANFSGRQNQDCDRFIPYQSYGLFSKTDNRLDRGGTFTDVWASAPNRADIVLKLLSVDPENYNDAPTEGMNRPYYIKHCANVTSKGIRRVLSMYGKTDIPRGVPLPKENLDIVRMGTTVATNALLERKGRRHALLVTKGFRDLLRIGYQTRPRLFDLDIVKPEVLFSEVREIDERVTIEGFDEDLYGTVKTDVEEIPGVLVRGSSGDLMRILQPLDEAAVRNTLQELRSQGLDTVAVCFTHSHIYGEHEERVGEIAQEVGFNHISLSSTVAAKMIKMVPRGSSASADAYLTPEIKDYLRGFVKGFKCGHLDDVKCDFMQSDGGLVSHKGFSGLKGILSGPAGEAPLQ